MEVMVAFAIAGLLLAAVPMAFNKGLESMRYHTMVRDLIGDLRGARVQAMLSGQDAKFEVDVSAQLFGVVGKELKSVPGDLKMDAIVAETDANNRNKGVIRFYPDGSATGGSVSIVRKSGAGVRLRVDWLLGRITQETLEVRG